MAKTIQSPGSFLTMQLEKHKLNPFRLSKDIQLSQSAVRLIVLGKTRVSVPVAMRLAKYFNTAPEYWLNMQMKWDLNEASRDKDLMKIIRNISKFQKGLSAGKKPAVKIPSSAKKPKAKKKATVKAVKKPAAAKTKKTAARGRRAAK